MSIKETRREMDDESAFNELCNTPDIQVEDEDTNTLLVGNRRFAFMAGLKYARAQGHDFSGTEHNEPPVVREERDEVAEDLTAATLAMATNGDTFGSSSSEDLSPSSTDLSPSSDWEGGGGSFNGAGASSEF